MLTNPGPGRLIVIEGLDGAGTTTQVHLLHARLSRERSAYVTYEPSEGPVGLLIRTALDLFDKLYARRMLLRLIGVQFSGLVHGHYQISLFDDTEEGIRLYQAMDLIRARHGKDKLTRAVTLEQ